MRSLNFGLAVAAALMIAAAPAGPAFAEPPPWAPAHGWRAKHHGHDRHREVHVYHHYDRADDYGRPVIVTRGASYRCDRSLLDGNKTLLAQILGGAGGAVAGSQFGKGTGKLAATAGGALLGVLIGTEIGGSLDAADAACAQQALETADTGRPVVWDNPDRGTRYAMVPTRTYENAGTYCREYTTRASVGGRTQEAYGTACRRPDGSWRIVR
ncbi:hypothetical protein GCM10017083_25920 [Thalassobaculum fulvum]|uniref:17 kDa surface antigen n=1 Tax=Thalassobaculum fulvum TaxID=1633335 RepID=A0A918XS82_9PROT|nr:RT0821/Lpp0805 family surface protein [Thalassobaculum fulvum]GHD51451.1 hypothetical protein GCM10017083_25920 [Thalassobaculum fulvum]